MISSSSASAACTTRCRFRPKSESADSRNGTAGASATALRIRTAPVVSTMADRSARCAPSTAHITAPPNGASTRTATKTARMSIRRTLSINPIRNRVRWAAIRRLKTGIRCRFPRAYITAMDYGSIADPWLPEPTSKTYAIKPARRTPGTRGNTSTGVVRRRRCAGRVAGVSAFLPGCKGGQHRLKIPRPGTRLPAAGPRRPGPGPATRSRGPHGTRSSGAWRTGACRA